MKRASGLVMGLTAALLAAVLVSDVQAQRQGQGRRGQGGGGFGGNDKLSLLRRPDVRKELEIVSDQETKLTELQEEMGQKTREAFSGLRDLEPEERRTKIREATEKIRKELDQSLEQVLLPNQRDRLSQIYYQMQLRSLAGGGGFGGFGGGFGGPGGGGAGGGRGGDRGGLNSEIATALGVDEETQRKIRDKAREVERETQQKIEKVREEARDKILETLSPEQREKLKKMLGTPYRPAPPQPKDDI
jgi:Spy/CpxP family protein refolding chaperone